MIKKIYDYRTLHMNEKIEKAVDIINNSEYKIVFITDDKDRFIGSVTDGDIRRNLEKFNLQDDVYKIMNDNPKKIYERDNYSDKDIYNFKVNYLPLLDEKGKIKTVYYIDVNFQKNNKIKTKVLIMAGGKGTRLLPLTRVIPKPLVPFKDETIIENIMGQFLKYGFDEFVFSVNYKKDMIKNYFKELKYNIDYIEETKFLGTAGSIAFMKEYINNKPFIVSNCDILLDVDYSEALEKHIHDDIDITIFTATEEIDISYGVIKSDSDNNFLGIEEKPSKKYLVNTGIYILSPKIIELIEKNEKIDMPELIDRARERGMNIKIFESKNSMVDIGQWKHYKKFIGN
jgi:dTDP-glucose pyrophosphorylase